MMERKVWDGRFKGKVAIVTGGAAGIGRAIMEELCREGAAVCFSDMSDSGKDLEQSLRSQGYDVLFCQGDMQSEEFCKEIVDKTLQRWGRVDHLVNNAFSFTAKALDATAKDWERSFFVGPVGYARMVQFCAPAMIRQGGGSVVNISSISAHIAQIRRWTYNAAKGAVHMLTRCQALDLAKYNIRVNSISQGWIWTKEVEKSAEMAGGGYEKWGPIWGECHMLERIGQPIEVAGPALFLLSDDASFITGTDLAVDGGYLAMGPEGIGKTTFNAGSA